MNAIQIKNVTKQYKDVIALDNISFSFEHGKIYGFLGRNGAGKSTLINIIANRIFADSGEVLIDDIPAKENMKIHDKIFCMSEADLYDTNLKIKDQFKWIARFYDDFDKEKALEIANKFNLNINKKFKALSKGYQSIFKLTVALSLNVPYVIYDEPVLGLDANHRELFYDLLLKDYENSERTIIIATHLIEEVANLNVHKFLAGHLGGEQQMGALIENNEMDMVIFLRDPLSPKSHEPDVNKAVRLCDIHNVPLATNLATAELLIKALDRGDLEWREMYK